MSKNGMRRFDEQPPQGTANDEPKRPEPPHNNVAPVPELQGESKRTKEKSKPIFYK